MNDDTNSKTNDRRIGRRTVLGGLSASFVALTGCSTSIPRNDAPNSSSSDPPEGKKDSLTSVEMVETELVVKLPSSADIDSVNLLNPDGETNAIRRIQDGTTQVAFQLLGETEDGYVPGEYRIVAITGDKTVDETTITLEPKIDITDVKRAQDYPDLNWDKEQPSWEQFAAVTVENTGNAPSYLTALRWENSPHTKVSPSEALTHYLRRIIPPGETTIYTTAPVYRTQDPTGAYEAVDCGSLERDTLTVTGNVQTGKNPTFSQTVEYGGKKYSCDLTIVDGGSTSSLKTNESDT